MNFFDFLNAINTTKKDILREDPQAEKEYAPFMINRGLSYFPDTIMYANEMNSKAGIPKGWQFDFYLNGVSKRKRFSKWQKKEKLSEDVEVVMKEYDYSSVRAMEVLDILTPDQLKSLHQKYDKGGK